LGNPRIAEGAYQSWRENLRRLATFPNVSCKISGMVTRARKDWQPADLKPYLDCALESFGFERVMFGSDWPVCTLACALRRWLEVLGELTNRCTQAQRQQLFAGNATRIFHPQP